MLQEPSLKFNFCQDQTTGSLSRLSVSFMVLKGVFEDIEVPDKAQNGVKNLGQPLGCLTKKVHQNWTSGSILKVHYKHTAYGGLFLGFKASLINFCWIQKQYPPHNIYGEKLCIPKIPYFTHFTQGHFFGIVRFRCTQVTFFFPSTCHLS